MDFQNAYSVPFRGSDVACPEPSLAQQHFAEDTDINVMLERFKVTGQLPVASREAIYGDFTDVGDFRQAMDRLRAAQAAFLSVPVEIRQQFGNDPGAFSEFCLDKSNLPKLREWGFAPPAPEPARAPEPKAEDKS